MSSRNTDVKECILCEKFNTHIYFGICVICHLKIDEAMPGRRAIQN